MKLIIAKLYKKPLPCV